MPGLRGTFDAAVTAHMTAVGTINATRAALDSAPNPPPPPDLLATEAALAARLDAAASHLDALPTVVRLGTARLHAASFGVYVPFLSSAHLCLSADAKDARVAALIRSVLLQAIAKADPGTVDIVTVDAASVGASVAALRPLVDAGRMSAPATDDAGFTAALARAEAHVKGRLSGERGTTMILAIASAPSRANGVAERIEALARSGVAAGLHIIAAGFSGLPDSVDVTVGEHMRVANPPGAPFGTDGGLAADVHFDPPPSTDYVRAEAARLAEVARAASVMTFADVRPAQLWTHDPSERLTTVAGRDASGTVTLAFDDATPHWLIGGRTGGGKTVFLLDILYGLAARYSPQDLALYLLDFKEGVSFTEFTPRPGDPTFIPHARAVGIESDREYGVAILRELDAEMTRRSVAMKAVGVARYAQLRAERPVPRIVCVIDEFHVLFAGNDGLAKEAVSLLENVARKGRSYGIHLVLASQTTSGIEALYTKRDSIFGQFGLRIALPGATGVLDTHNTAANGLRTGEAVVNPDGGLSGRDRVIRFPNAHAEPEELRRLRHDLWQARGDIAPPTVFRGYAAVHIDDDPAYAALAATATPSVLLGRYVDAGLPTVALPLDTRPGSHLAIIGPDVAGAHLLHAAALSLRAQVPDATFVVAGLAEADTVADTVAALGSSIVEHVDATGLGAALTALPDRTGPVYVLGFGLDSATLTRPQQEALRTVLRTGPASGVHLLGWWRNLRRHMDDLGPGGREDVATSIVLNVPGHELLNLYGQSVLGWNPRPNRALLIDRHANTRRLIVPFSRREATA